MSGTKSDFSNMDDDSHAQEADLAAEAIASGQEKVKDIDVSSDYENAKEYSVSSIDKTGEGATAAESATAPNFQMHQPETAEVEAKPTGNPDDYLAMAREVQPQSSGKGNVSDDVVKKALEMERGQSDQ